MSAKEYYDCMKQKNSSYQYWENPTDERRGKYEKELESIISKKVKLINSSREQEEIARTGFKPTLK